MAQIDAVHLDPPVVFTHSVSVTGSYTLHGEDFDIKTGMPYHAQAALIGRNGTNQRAPIVTLSEGSIAFSDAAPISRTFSRILARDALPPSPGLDDLTVLVTLTPELPTPQSKEG